MVNIEICAGVSHWSRFTDFYLRHRERIIPEYKVRSALQDVRNYIRHGRGAILTDESEEVVGIGCFVLGLEDRGFSNKEIAVLGNSFFVEKYRNNRTFVRGLQVLAEQIKDAAPDVKEVRIPTAADNPYTNGLYGKFAERVLTSDTPYGLFNVYSTSYEAFAGFCGRFSDRG